MKDFRLYDIMDFVMDEDFIRWVQEKRPEDEAFWTNWLQQYPEKHLLVAEARRILESIHIEESVFSAAELDREADRLLQTIRDQPFRLNKGRVKTIPSRWLMAAVTIGVIVAAVVYKPTDMPSSPEISEEPYTYARLTSSKSLIEQVNTSDKPIIVSLADGSQVELAVNSRISYPRSFDSAGSRDVYLSGEAFFRVARNPNMPFRVFANEIVTKVLGTSFMVRSFEKDSVIQVTVKTGKVSVYSQSGATATKKKDTPEIQSGIILTPNQQLTYSKEEQKFHKLLLPRPVMIVPVSVDRSMVYEDTPLEEVFAQISKAYGINIVYDNELLKNCTVTADLRKEAFYDKLDLICRAIGATYEVIDGQVVITSNGCL